MISFGVAFFLMTGIALYLNQNSIHDGNMIERYKIRISQLEREMLKLREVVTRLEDEVDESMRADYWAERYKELEKRCGKQ